MAAGYQKPLVLVYQEFNRLSPSLGNPDLSPCIIGPAFAIYNIEDDKEVIRAGLFEYDTNFNVSVTRKGIQYPNKVTLQVAPGLTPAYIFTFTEIQDFETQYNIKEGAPDEDAGEFWYQRANQNLTLTYNEAVTTVKTQTIDLGLA